MDTNTDWSDIKEQYSDQIIDTITEDYIPNLKEIVLKKVTYSPVDYEKKAHNLYQGDSFMWSCSTISVTVDASDTSIK